MAKHTPKPFYAENPQKNNKKNNEKNNKTMKKTIKKTIKMFFNTMIEKKFKVVTT